MTTWVFLMLHPFITTKTIKDNRSESVRTDSHLFFYPLGVIKFAQEKGKNYICTNK